MFSVITPTGGRPEAFALSEEWMKKQSALQDNPEWEWIVVDDCFPRTPTTMNQVVLNVKHKEVVGAQGTQHLNLQLAFTAARGEYLIMWEDDDHYGPNYLKNTLENLRFAPLVGERPSRYYHIGQRRFREFDNNDHASLCQTAFHRSMIPAVLEQCKTDAYIDVELWRQYGKQHSILYASNQVVGIKGMPGRKGISGAHECRGADWRGDIDLARLRQWIGPDAERYRQYGRL
jgi:hypothetical protein